MSLDASIRRCATGSGSESRNQFPVRDGLMRRCPGARPLSILSRERTRCSKTREAAWKKMPHETATATDRGSY